jgi:hypothetical protein
VVERDLAKVEVAGSTPVSRSKVLQESPYGRFSILYAERPAMDFFCVQSSRTKSTESTLGMQSLVHVRAQRHFLPSQRGITKTSL